MNEIVFKAVESKDGGYFTRAVNHGIFTRGETINEIKVNICDAVRCHFDEEDLPKIIHLHLTHKETFALP